MDPEAAGVIQQKLDSDEVLLWAGRPRPLLVLLYPALFSLIFGFVYLFPPKPGRATSFVMAALLVLVLIVSWSLIQSTFYGLTNRRAILVGSPFGRSTISSASFVNRLEEPIVIRRGFPGRVIFGRVITYKSVAISGMMGRSPDDPDSGVIFIALANPQQVVQQALKAQQSMLDAIEARIGVRHIN